MTCATGCGRPTRDTLLLCNGCLWALECDLGDVAWLDEQLELVLSRLAVVGEHNGGRSAETPMPVHPGALKARSDLRAALVGWVRDFAEGTMQAWPADTLAAMASWLLKRIDRIAVHPAAEDIHGEIVGAVRFAARVIDLPANRTTFPVGPCPEIGCQGEIRAYIPAQPERPARMECSACETRWEPHQWLRAGRRILARKGEAIGYVDVQVAAQSMGVSGQTIRNWMLAGKLTNHGSAQKFMVDLTELLRVMDAVA
jgi:hypothetical protein